MEKSEEDGSVNSYNCPVVTGYPDVIDSSISPLTKFGIPFDAPIISFLNEDLLYKGCKAYFVNILGIDKKDFDKAFKKALKEQNQTVTINNGKAYFESFEEMTL